MFSFIPQLNNGCKEVQCFVTRFVRVELKMTNDDWDWVLSKTYSNQFWFIIIFNLYNQQENSNIRGLVFNPADDPETTGSGHKYWWSSWHSLQICDFGSTMCLLAQIRYHLTVIDRSADKNLLFSQKTSSSYNDSVQTSVLSLQFSLENYLLGYVNLLTKKIILRYIYSISLLFSTK